MALSDDYRPRLSIVLTEEQRNRLGKLLPWGVGRSLFSAIVDELIIIIEKHGMAAVGLLISKKVSLIDLLTLEEYTLHAASRPETEHRNSTLRESYSANSGDQKEPKIKQKASRKGKRK